jgi:lipoprotein-anchoring transpeptidase ErfK/SrfK
MKAGAILAALAAVAAIPAAIFAAPLVSSEFLGSDEAGAGNAAAPTSVSAAATAIPEISQASRVKNAETSTPSGVNEPSTNKQTKLSQPPGGWKRSLLSPTDASRAYRGGILPSGVKSVLNTSQTLSHGQYMWEEEGVAKGDLAIFVDLRRQMVSVFRDGHEIGTAVVVYGAQTHKTPLGDFPVKWRARDYHSRKYDAPMPYSLFITDDRVALHGSPMADDRATHGCIGLPLEFARKLFEIAEPGDVVTIVRSDPDQIERVFSQS